jgi:valyl-tRNA synthetase
MPHDLPKAYDPAAIEDRWAEYWVRENLFAQPTPPDGEAGQPEQYSILLPPPNVTGQLHMGHMFEQAEIDILIRWRRMTGRRALWVPGTDHAGIATQLMVERQLATEGKTRQQLGREAFEERVWQWKRHYGGAILDQMKRLGASVDWSREYFTMDENLSVAVREAFVRLHEQGLIYRGAYIVNWCPRCQTAISDLEVVYDEHKGHLWEIRYPVIGADGPEGSPSKETGEYLSIATTRPETMLGDVAVAIHPEDARYLHLHGKKLRLPLVGREIPIVLDEWVSREFGTGAVKVTPAHDPNDFALGERHNLPQINVMDNEGKINAEGGAYAGLDRYVARKRIVADLEALGLLVAIKDHTNNVGHCDRCKTVVEPRLSTQWFVRIQPLADKAIAAVKEGHIQFTPEMYTRTYLNWMENIHDWCISRQLWWGHRIPAWHCAACRKITVARVDPTACAHCGSAQIVQETDVLDTWFSSGLLPVSVFGWPNLTAKENVGAPGPSHLGTGEGGHDCRDFDAFYPTSLMVTGFDILFFWVARMIMLGCWFSTDVPMPDGSPRSLADSVPFRKVHIHALVRDANREKMSKTKGNVIDPIVIVKEYGTDAVRFTLASMASPGTDIAFNIARTEGYRAFANKIWNAARFIFMNVDRAAEVGIKAPIGNLLRTSFFVNKWPIEELWILSRLNRTAYDVNLALEKFRFDDAANLIYQFFWGEFCDWYLEIVKLRLDFTGGANKEEVGASLAALLYVFEASLRMLSPFMPFITEEIWHALYNGNPPRKSIALMNYPQYESHDVFTQLAFDSSEIAMDHVQLAMERLKEAISALRSSRKDIGVDEKVFVNAKIASGKSGVLRKNAEILKHLDLLGNPDVIKKLAKVNNLEIVFFSERDGKYAHLPWQTFGAVDVYVEFEKSVDIAAERERLTKDIARYEKGLAAAERQLGNEGFLAKAPTHVVDGLKKQEAETRLLLKKAREALDGLAPE